jgi:dTDP-glucose 4,6-dehydratase
MKVLLAGGAGFLGKNLAAFWSGRFPGDHLVVVDTLRRNARDVGILQQVGGVTVLRGDAADSAFVQAVMEAHDVDLVVNLTCVAGVDRAAADPASAVATDVAATVSLLEACRRTGGVRFHQVSSAEVFGATASSRPATGRSAYSPRTIYGASKASADHFVAAYGQCHGVPATISIAPNTYGPYQALDQVVPRFTANAIGGEPLPLYGGGRHVREWLHVADHCAGIAAAARCGRPGTSYVLASGVHVPIASLAAKLLDLLDRPASLLRSLPDRPGDHNRPPLDGSGTGRDLGWSPAVGFEDGLRGTVDWYLRNRDWWASAATPTEPAWTPRRRAS